MPNLDSFLFVALPYVALVIFFVMTIQRYRERTFTYSSLSSQFLENKHHFWSSVPFHYGILGVLSLHLLAIAFPKQVLGWSSAAVRLWALEVTGLALGLAAAVGLLNILWRRVTEPKCRVVTSTGDWVLYALLFVQFYTGLHIALRYGWGYTWFAASASPYLWSLLKLNPQVAYVAPLPLLVKLHIANAFLIVAYFPFTRLVHILVVPNPYLWRRTQVVRWYRPRGTGKVHP